jgi:hypothetical protein
MALTKVKLISDGVIIVDNLAANHGITTTHISEGNNLYYTDARVGSYLSANNYITTAGGYFSNVTLSANILTFDKSDGTTDSVDLSLYLDDTNLARLVSGTLDALTGVATFTRDDSSTFTIDFSAFLSDANDYVSSGSFDTSTGVLTLTRLGGATVTVDLDGKYAESVHTHVWTDITDRPTALSSFTNDLGNYGGFLTSYTETDPIYTASSWYTTTNNASNWNTAYGWGNHANAGYLTSLPSHNHDGVYLPILGKAADSELLDGYNLSGADSVSSIIFNNKGQAHATYTDFNTSMNAGANYLQGGTNGPTGSGQWYGVMLGLGGEYNTQTYASQLYWGRQSIAGTDTYLWARDLENTNWGSWRKMSAGNADYATNAGDSQLLDGIDGSGYLRVSPNSSTPYNGNFAIGNNGTTNFIQSHSGQTLEINPLGNSVTINGNAAIHAGNIGSQSVSYASNAGTLDSIDSSQFLRRDVNGTLFSGSASLAFENQSSFARMAFYKLDFWDWDHGRQLVLDGNYVYVDNYLQAGNSLRAPIFYDSDDTGHYINVASSGLSANFNGNIEVYARSAAWAEGVRIRVPATNTWGGIRWTRDRANYDGNWALGFKGAGDTTDDLVFWANNGGSEGDKARLDKAGNFTAVTSFRAPIFYDSNDTGYYLDPNSSSTLNNVLTRRIKFIGEGGDSGMGTEAYAIFQEGGAWSHPYPDLRIAFHTGIKLGANASYQGIRFYTDYDMSAQVMSVNNGSDALGGGNVYVNNSLQAGSSLRAPIFYDSNNTGYYLNPDGFSNLHSATFNANWAGGSPHEGTINIRGNYPSMMFRNFVSNTAWLRHMDGSGNIQHYYVPDGYDSANWSIKHTMTGGGMFYSSESHRAPIFYDSDDTNYFVNLASGSEVCYIIAKTCSNYSGGYWTMMDGYGFDYCNPWGGYSSLGTHLSVGGDGLYASYTCNGAGGYSNNDSWSLYPWELQISPFNGEKFYYDSYDGALYIGGTLYQNYYSDCKYKTNITEIDSALDKIDSMRGVEFDWNELGLEEAFKKGHEVGVIAQEVQSVYPLAVREVSKERPEKVVTALVVDYEKLIPLLLQGIKELRQEINDIKQQINGGSI